MGRRKAAHSRFPFFALELDPDANRMAAFTAPDPADREAFAATWARIPVLRLDR